MAQVMILGNDWSSCNSSHRIQFTITSPNGAYVPAVDDNAHGILKSDVHIGSILIYIVGSLKKEEEKYVYGKREYKSTWLKFITIWTMDI